MMTLMTQCDYCREEVTDRCRKEHPEWFTLKKKEIKSRHLLDVRKYVDQNTPTKRCMATYNSEIDGPDEAFCATHLRIIAEEIERETGEQS